MTELSDKVYELERNIRELELDGASVEELDSLFAEMGKVALEEKNAYLAVKAFERLKDMEGLRKAANLGLKTNNLYDTLIAFQVLGDEEGIQKCIDKNVGQGVDGVYDSVLEESVEDLKKRFYGTYKKFLKKKHFKDAAAFYIPHVINAANLLAPDYDIGVSIAKGGLFSGYVFELYGLPVIVSESHKKGELWKWHGSPKEIKDKKVLVLDKDCSTGGTLRRSVQEIQKHSPKSLGVFFNHSAVYTNLKAVPGDFKKVYYPGNLTYERFNEARTKLREMLK